MIDADSFMKYVSFVISVNYRRTDNLSQLNLMDIKSLHLVKVKVVLSKSSITVKLVTQGQVGECRET